MTSYQVLVVLAAFCVLACCGCSGRPLGDPDPNYYFGRRVVAFVDAAEARDSSEIGRLAAEGIDLNAEGTDGMTTLFWCILRGKRLAFLQLLEHGANPNKPFIKPCNAIAYSVTHAAAVLADPFWLESALKHGADPNLVETNTDQRTPIFYAIRYYRKANLDLLIKAGANLNHRESDFGCTPMIYAAHLFWFEGVHRLLEVGADHRVKSKAGFDIAASVLVNDVGIIEEARLWRAKVLSFLDRKGVDWEAARKRCVEKGMKTLDIDTELKWAGLERDLRTLKGVGSAL